MQRYFFDLHECGTHVEDEEGRELVDIVDARRSAIAEAREVMSHEVREGRLCLSCRIDVRDEVGTLVLTLPFREALAVTGV